MRTALGKPPSGTIALAARKLGNRLSLTIEDDGAGVDVADVRARAVAAGLVTRAIAEAADDDTLLSLLFLPGFSTRESTDLLAGRGIGLEIARSGVQRMGGAIRLSSRRGRGVQRAHRRAHRQRAGDGALGRRWQAGVRVARRERPARAPERGRRRRPPPASDGLP